MQCMANGTMVDSSVRDAPLAPASPSIQKSDGSAKHARQHDDIDGTVTLHNASVSATMVEDLAPETPKKSAKSSDICATPSKRQSSQSVADAAKSTPTALEGSDLSSVESELLESDSDAERPKGRRMRRNDSGDADFVAESDGEDSYFSALSSMSGSESNEDGSRKFHRRRHHHQQHATKTSQRSPGTQRKKWTSQPFDSTESDSSSGDERPRTKHHDNNGIFTGEESSSSSNSENESGEDRIGATSDDDEGTNGYRKLSPRERANGQHERGSSEHGRRRRRRAEAELMRPNHRDRSGRTAIFRSIANNELHGVKRLLDMHADVNVHDHAGWTPLHEACIYGNMEVVRCLIERRANVNAVGKNGDTPLHDAARCGWQDVVELLLQAGGNPDAANKRGQRPGDVCSQYPAIRGLLAKRLRLQQLTKTRDRAGQTMLHKACARNRVAEVLDLLNCGANVDAIDYAGWTPLHEAALEGHTGIVKLLLANGANPNAGGHLGDTPLHDACQNEHISVVRLLLEHGADARCPNEAGHRPIDVTEEAQIVELLQNSIKNGRRSSIGSPLSPRSQLSASTSTPNLCTTSSEANRTQVGTKGNATSPACASKTTKHQSSLSGSSSATTDRTGCESGVSKSSGGDGQQQLDASSSRSPSQTLHRRQQSSPALSSSTKGSNGSLKRDRDLIKDCQASDDDDNDDASVYQQARRENGDSSRNRKTARMCRSQSPEMYRGKRATSESTVDFTETDGRPLSREERKMQQLMATIRRLEERDERKKRRRRRHVEGSESPQPSAFAARESVATGVRAGDAPYPPVGKRRPGRPRRVSRTPPVSVTAPQESNTGEGTEEQEAKRRLQETSEMDRRARQRDSSGRTALHRRAKRNDCENCRKLLSHGADVNARDNAGWTPLHEASLAGHVEVVRLLLSHGADVTIQAENLDTPLHDAAEAGYVEVVQLLLEAGARIDTQNEDGKTPLQLVELDNDEEATDEERQIAAKIRTLMHTTPLSLPRRTVSGARDESEGKRGAGDDPANVSDASTASNSRRKRRLVSGRQLASLCNNGTDNITDEKPPVPVKPARAASRPLHRSIDETTVKCEESEEGALKEHRRSSPPNVALVKQEPMEQRISPPVQAPVHPLSSTCTADHTFNAMKARSPVATDARPLDMSHAKRFLPLYTVQLDTTAESAPNSVGGFFVIDLQVRLLLNLPTGMSLFARYPGLQRRSVGRREKERFWGPLACMLLAEAVPATTKWMPVLTPERKEQEKHRFLTSDIFFVRLDDVVGIIRRDYPNLSEQLITIKLDLSFSDDATPALRSCVEESKESDASAPVQSTDTAAPCSSATTTATSVPAPFSFPAKFAMKFNKMPAQPKHSS